MDRYQIIAPDGRKVTVEGDAPPTEADADEIFASLPPVVKSTATAIQPVTQPVNPEDMEVDSFIEGKLPDNEMALFRKMAPERTKGMTPDKIDRINAKMAETGTPLVEGGTAHNTLLSEAIRTINDNASRSGDYSKAIKGVDDIEKSLYESPDVDVAKKKDALKYLVAMRNALYEGKEKSNRDETSGFYKSALNGFIRTLGPEAAASVYKGLAMTGRIVGASDFAKSQSEYAQGASALGDVGGGWNTAPSFDELSGKWNRDTIGSIFGSGTGSLAQSIGPGMAVNAIGRTIGLASNASKLMALEKAGDMAGKAALIGKIDKTAETLGFMATMVPMGAQQASNTAYEAYDSLKAKNEKLPDNEKMNEQQIVAKATAEGLLAGAIESGTEMISWHFVASPFMRAFRMKAGDEAAKALAEKIQDFSKKTLVKRIGLDASKAFGAEWGEEIVSNIGLDLASSIRGDSELVNNLKKYGFTEGSLKDLVWTADQAAKSAIGVASTLGLGGLQGAREHSLAKRSVQDIATDDEKNKDLIDAIAEKGDIKFDETGSTVTPVPLTEKNPLTPEAVTEALDEAKRMAEEPAPPISDPFARMDNPENRRRMVPVEEEPAETVEPTTTPETLQPPQENAVNEPVEPAVPPQVVVQEQPRDGEAVRGGDAQERPVAEAGQEGQGGQVEEVVNAPTATNTSKHEQAVERLSTIASDFLVKKLKKSEYFQKDTPERQQESIKSRSPDQYKTMAEKVIDAIDNKKAGQLIQWNNGVNDVVWKLFSEYTGIKVPQTQTGKGMMLRQFLGTDVYNAEQDRIRQYNEERRRQDEEKHNAFVADNRTRRAQSVQINDGENTVDGKTFVDNKLDDGYQIQNISKTKIPRYAFVKGEKYLTVKNSDIMAYARMEYENRQKKQPKDQEAPAATPAEKVDTQEPTPVPAATTPKDRYEDMSKIFLIRESRERGLNFKRSMSEDEMRRALREDDVKGEQSQTDNQPTTPPPAESVLAGRLEKAGMIRNFLGKWQYRPHVNTDKWLTANSKEDAVKEANKYILGIKKDTETPATETNHPETQDQDANERQDRAEGELLKRARSENMNYDQLVEVYNNQPTPKVRTSDSMMRQAYSTPLPLAYIADTIAGVDKADSFYDATGGTGHLAIRAKDHAGTVLNELDPIRASILRENFPNSTVVEGDALQHKPGRKFQSIVINPPFGSKLNGDGSLQTFTAPASKAKGGEYKTTQIDHAIALNALSHLEDDGTAVVIVGGVSPIRKNKAMEYGAGSKNAFYIALYNDYNVVDHFTVNGDLYKNQGAAWPVDVIVIKGKGKSQLPLPFRSIPRIYNSWSELKEVLSDEYANKLANGSMGVQNGNSDMDTSVGAGKHTEPSGDQRVPVANSEEGVPATGSGGATGHNTGVSTGLAGTGRGKRGSGKTVRPASTARVPDGAANSGTDSSQRDISRGGAEKQGEVGISGEGTLPSTIGYAGKDSGSTEQPRIDKPKEPQDNELQAVYPSKSRSNSIGSLVPSNMLPFVQKALDNLESEVGDIDSFVASELKIPVKDLNKHFMAEQVDAIALALNQIKKGRGFIIGDQTGLGKGRVNAAIIKWGRDHGKTTIFCTEQPNLYSDMMRDLVDIGVAKSKEDLLDKVFMTNSGEEVPVGSEALLWTESKQAAEENKEPFTLKRPKNGWLKTPSNEAHARTIHEIIAQPSKLSGKTVFTTYSQLQTVRGATTHRRQLLDALVPGSILVLDESHNAGGGKEPRKNRQDDGEQEEPNRAKYVKELAGQAEGVLFSSATYAKRPESMGLYMSKTDMEKANVSADEARDTLIAGGVPLQQINANMLTEAGQYLRRERSYNGITYEPKYVDIREEPYSEFSEVLRRVNAFSQRTQAFVDDHGGHDDDGSAMGAHAGANQNAISTINFGSVMHNLINQFLLSSKIESVVKFAKEQAKDNKVVITLSNTMGAAIDSYVNDNGIKDGEAIDISMKDLMLSYLRKTRTVTTKDPFSKEKAVHHFLTDEEIGPVGVQMYNQTEQYISSRDWSFNPVSPIDALISKLNEEGLKVGEITGRQNIISHGIAGDTLAKREHNISTKIATINSFNSKGGYDVLIINRAGSTGLSVHASPHNVRPGVEPDLRPRVMLIAQAEGNIDTHMQILGRINRTGQVALPKYYQIIGNVAGEKRPAAIILGKMASLNAATTASRKGKMSESTTKDILNKYGDVVVSNVLLMRPDFADAMDVHVFVDEDGDPMITGLARKATGHVPLMTNKMQAEFYDIVEREYDEVINMLNATGQNDLGVEVVDLEAEKISEEDAIPGDPSSSSPFDRPVKMVKYRMKRSGKPFTIDEIRERISSLNTTPQEFSLKMRQKLGDALREKFEELAKAGGNDVATKQQDAQKAHDKVMKILNSIPLSGSVTINTEDGAYSAYGFVTNVKVSGNPLAPSNWKAEFAVSDPSKTLTVPFSQIGKNFIVESVRSNEAKEAFEHGSTGFHETRLVLEGNLLKAYTKVRGAISIFLDKTRQLRQGIITRRGTTEKTLTEKIASTVDSVDDAMRSFNDGNIIGDPQKHISISQTPGGIKIFATKGRTKGGKYSLNPDFVALIGGRGFETTRRGEMTAFIHDYQTLRQVLEFVGRDTDNKFSVTKRPQYRDALDSLPSGDKLRAVVILRNITGTLNVSLHNKIFDHLGNLKSGAYHKAMMYLSTGTGNIEENALHEGVHFIEDVLLTDQENADLKRIEPDAERRAEGLVNYVKTNKVPSGKYGFKDRLTLKNIWDKLVSRVKNFFYGDRLRTLEEFYEKALSGEYAKRTPRQTPEVKPSKEPVTKSDMSVPYDKLMAGMTGGDKLTSAATGKTMTPRTVDTPLKLGGYEQDTGPSVEEHRFGKRVVEGKDERLSKKVLDNINTEYFQRSHTQRQADTEAFFKENTDEEAYTKFMNDDITVGKVKKDVRIDVGQELLRRHGKEKAWFNNNIQIINKINDVATVAGRIIESFKMWGPMLETTEGAARLYQKMYDKAMMEANKSKVTIQNITEGFADTLKWAEEVVDERVKKSMTILSEALKSKPNALDDIRKSNSNADFSKYKDSAVKFRDAELDAKIDAAANYGADLLSKEMKAADWKKAMIEKYGDGIKPFIGRVKNESLNKLSAALGIKLRKSGETSTEKMRERMLGWLKNKGVKTWKPSSKKALDQLMKMYDNGWLTEEDFQKEFGNRFDMKELTPEVFEEIGRLAEAVRKAPEGFQKNDATMEMMKYVHMNTGGISTGDIIESLWYNNILSGPMTHFRNLFSTSLQTTADIAMLAAVNPTYAFNVLSGAWGGINPGKVEAKAQLKTGKSLVRNVKLEEYNDASEMIKFRGGKLNPLNWMKFVGRALRAEDILPFKIAQEAKMALIAAKIAKGDKELLAELLQNSPAHLARFKEQAIQEGLSGYNVQRRMFELVEQNRDPALMEAAADFGSKATFNYDTEGELGKFAEGVAVFTRNYRPAKIVIPFTRIVANLTDQWLNYTPAGTVRAIRGKRYVAKSKDWRSMDSDERKMDVLKSVIGTTAFLALMAAAGGDPDDDKDKFSIWGFGPPDKNKRDQLAERGIRPFSMKIFGRTYQYTNTPLALPMSISGNLLDIARYKKNASTEDMVWLGIVGSMSVMLNQSILSGVMNFTSALANSENSGAAMLRYVSRLGSSAIPFAPFLSQLDRGLYDDTKKETDSIASYVMATIPLVDMALKPKLNALGGEIRPSQLPVKSITEDPVWKLLAKARYFIPKMQKPKDMKTKEPISDAEFYRLQELRGKLIRQMIVDNMKDLKDATQEEAHNRLANLVKAATAAATNQSKTSLSDD